MHFLFLEPHFFTEKQGQNLENKGIKYDLFDPNSKKELIEFLQLKSGINYDAVFVKIGLRFDEEVLNAIGPQLKYLLTPTTGTDHIDLEFASSRKISVFSLKTELSLIDSIPSTAEHSWALLLSLCRKIVPSHSDVMRGNWEKEKFLGTELFGKKIGIIGFGRLGKKVARYANVFSLPVLAHDIDEKKITEFQEFPAHASDIETIFRDCDIISIHVPLNDSTQNLIHKDHFNLIPEEKNTIFINTSRGKIVDESALLAALQNKTVAACGLDVLSEEIRWDKTIDTHSGLIEYARKNDNLLITPHIGGYTQEATHKTRSYLLNKLLTIISSD